MQLTLRPVVRDQRRFARHFVGRALRFFAAVSLGAGAVVAARPASAQDATAFVTGRITASDGNTPLGGATIFVTGTQTGALSRTHGTSPIAPRPGRYELRVRFIGWSGTHDSVTVAAGQTITRNFALER